MPNTNLENAKNNMKTRIRNRVSVSTTPRDLGRLAKSAKFVGLVDDSEVESDLNTQMAAAIPAASIDDLVEMSEGINELRDRSGNMGGVSSADHLTEGGNKFLNANSVQPALSVSGDLSYDNGVVSYTTPTSAALQVVATVGDLPAGASAGDQAVVQSNNKLYIKTAEGWYAVALINTAPSVSGNDASYTLATDQTPTVVTMTATDPENDPVTFSYSVSSGSLNGTTVNQADNVFTITPHASNPATFELTFSADDTVNVATSSVSTFTLAFSTDWTGTPNLKYTLDDNNVATSATSPRYGRNVAVGDFYYAVAAQEETVNGMSEAGRIFIYSTSTGSLVHTLNGTEQNERIGNDGQSNGQRGFIIDGNVLFAGTSIGRLYIIDLSLLSGGVEAINTSTALKKILYAYEDQRTSGTGDYSSGIAVMRNVPDTVGNIVGDYLFVGMPGNDRVLAYNITDLDDINGVPHNQWTRNLADNNMTGDYRPSMFGATMQVSGSMLLVGSPDKRLPSSGMNTQNTGRYGAAYLLHPSNGLIQNSVDYDMNSVNGNPNNPGFPFFGTFGYSVSVTGTAYDDPNALIAVSAEKEWNTGSTGSNGSENGAVYIFQTDGTYLRKIDGRIKSSSARFGHTMEFLDDDHIAISSVYEQNENGNYAGAVYIFNARTGAQVTRLISPSSGQRGFGRSLAVNKDAGELVIGQAGDNWNDKVFVYQF